MSDPIQFDAFQWRQIVDGATDTAIISTNRNGEVTSWSSGAERILGWTEREMVGFSLDRVFTPEDQEKGQFAREMADAISKGLGGGEEGWRVRKDGSRFWGVGELTPIRSRDGAITGFIKILRDRYRGSRRTLRVAITRTPVPGGPAVHGRRSARRSNGRASRRAGARCQAGSEGALYDRVRA
jgi:PAS domain S-box-containing protein